MTIAAGRRLVALDIDGTVLHDDGRLADRVRASVQRLVDQGHEVTLATGRSESTALPVLELLGIVPEYVVCSNGAITLRRSTGSPIGYRREFVETFDPSPVLRQVRDALRDAHYAVEDDIGYFRYTERFPAATVGLASEQVPFEELLRTKATRVVVISPGHRIDDFLALVERLGLHQVSYSVGWTAWLDIAPSGVNKATAMDRVRAALGFDRSQVVAVGDGRNDIELLRWASAHGVGAAMGQAPADVRAVASTVAPPISEDGLADVLDGIPAPTA